MSTRALRQQQDDFFPLTSIHHGNKHPSNKIQTTYNGYFYAQRYVGTQRVSSPGQLRHVLMWLWLYLALFPGSKCSAVTVFTQLCKAPPWSSHRALVHAHEHNNTDTIAIPRPQAHRQPNTSRTDNACIEIHLPLMSHTAWQCPTEKFSWGVTLGDLEHLTLQAREPIMLGKIVVVVPLEHVSKATKAITKHCCAVTCRMTREFSQEAPSSATRWYQDLDASGKDLASRINKANSRYKKEDTKIEVNHRHAHRKTVPLLILLQNTFVVSSSFYPFFQDPYPTMTTRPSRKAPSSLLSATKASSARTRSSSRLKAKVAVDMTERAIDSIGVSEGGMTGDAAPSATSEDISTCLARNSGTGTGADATLDSVPLSKPTGLPSVKVRKDASASSSGALADEDIDARCGSLGAEPNSMPESGGADATAAGVTKTSFLFTTAAGASATAPGAEAAVAVVTNSNPVESAGAVDDASKVMEVGAGVGTVARTVDVARTAAGTGSTAFTDNAPPTRGTMGFGSNSSAHSTTPSAKKLYAQVAGTDAPFGGVTGVDADASKAMEVVKGAGTVAGTGAGNVAGTVAGTAAGTGVLPRPTPLPRTCTASLLPRRPPSPLF